MHEMKSVIYPQPRPLSQQKPVHILCQGLWEERVMSKMPKCASRENTPSTNSAAMLLIVPFDTHSLA